MPVTLPGPEWADLVATLRAAGCVYAEEEARLLTGAAGSAAGLAELVRRRAAGQPLEHVVGWAAFGGLRIVVAPGVFVPRRRTEFLVRQAAAVLRAAGGPGRPVVVDLCCGSGALGAALAAVAGPAEVHAVDIDPAAVRCAQANLGAVGGRVYQGDLDAPLPPGLRGRVAVLLANVPYVPTGEIALLPAEARGHEARVALDGGLDGLDLLRRVTAVAPGWLAPGAPMLSEVSDRQAHLATAVAARAGLVPRLARSAELGATVLIAARPPAGAGSTGGSLALGQAPWPRPRPRRDGRPGAALRPPTRGAGRGQPAWAAGPGWPGTAGPGTAGLRWPGGSRPRVILDGGSGNGTGRRERSPRWPSRCWCCGC